MIEGVPRVTLMLSEVSKMVISSLIVRGINEVQIDQSY